MRRKDASWEQTHESPRGQLRRECQFLAPTQKGNAAAASWRPPAYDFVPSQVAQFCVTLCADKSAAVPDLTFCADVKINKRCSLSPHKNHLRFLQIQELFIFKAINLLFRVPCGASLKRKKLTRAKIRGLPKGKSLSVRYAELLRLRRAVLKALSEKERT
jgi:hypothetical protein